MGSNGHEAIKKKSNKKFEGCEKNFNHESEAFAKNSNDDYNSKIIRLKSRFESSSSWHTSTKKGPNKKSE